MERKKASDFPPAVMKLFDFYVHGQIGRREFLERAAKFALGGVTAAAMLESLQPNFAWARQVAADDPRIQDEYLDYPSPSGSGPMRGYLARPAGATHKLPGVLVIHENRGLNPYIEDVVRRLALENFVAFAPDALSSVGGYPGEEDKARKLFADLDPQKCFEDFLAGFELLRSRPDCTGKVGAVGFCYGGGVVYALAVKLPELAAAVPFYGRQPSAQDAARIQAPLLVHHAGLDDDVNAGWPAFERALKAHNRVYKEYTYPGVHHGFHNDTTPRYDEAAATLAWSRTLDFLNKHLRI